MADKVNTIDEIGVAEFNRQYFCHELTSLYDDVITRVFPYKFAFQSELKDVELPVCSNIGSYAFYHCEKLSNISLPGLSSTYSNFGTSAFAYTGVTTIDFLPKSITTIPAGMFAGCSNLTGRIVLSSYINYVQPNAFAYTGIEEICAYAKSIYSAFKACGNLRNVELPNLVSLASNTFSECYSLENVSAPLLESISDYAFANCSKLAKVSFPACRYIGYSVFYNCTDLSTIYVRQDSCNLGTSNAFLSTKITFATGSIYVPASRVDYYRNSTNWNWFSTQIKGYDYENDRPVD